MSEYDPKNLEQFNKYKDIINNVEQFEDGPELDAYIEQEKSSTGKTQRVKTMEEIMSAFTDTVSKIEGLSEDTTASPKSNQALKQIQETYYNESDNSLNIGEYSIVKNDDNRYNLYDEHQKLIINNVMLYETIYTIASHLFRGQPFNSSKIMGILKLNESYEKYLTDAKYTKAQFNKYKTDMDYDEKEVQRVKFNENKSKASFYKKSIIKEYNNVS